MSDQLPTTELAEFLAHVNSGATIEGGSTHHLFMHGAAQDALRIAGSSTAGTAHPQKSAPC